ncbi:MAG: DUF1588 domain-containing protein [Myxococcales bacterium]|nr:DUF1588 domain-containing protein [Myxococcales bacterium]
MTRASLLLLLLLLAACSDDGSGDEAQDGPDDGDGGGSAGEGAAPSDDGDPGDGAGEPTGDPDIAVLSPQEHLTRASIALRGVRPALDELEAVAEDPRYVEAIIDFYLTTKNFGRTVREIHEEALLTGVDPAIYPAGFPAIGALAGRDLQEINTSVVEAPLRLIEHVVMSDRPYGEIVTADYTYGDDIVATVWGLDYDDSGPAWQQTQYQDGRPTAGILSDSFIFTRHSTTFSNKSRGRANAVSRALLCYDFLSRELPVDSGIDLADEDAVLEAVTNNPTCVGCHAALDPLAAYFASYYPIYVPATIDDYPFSVYEPTFRNVFSVTDPDYFGMAQGGIVELGQAMAEDPRFSSCAARRFYSFLTQTELEDVPPAVATRLQAVLVDSGMDAKALAKAVVMSDEFRASHAETDEKAEALVGLKRVRPRQLARMVERLTGYRWRTSLPIDLGGYGEVGDIDLMSDALFGFKVLAGGIDSTSVTRPSHTTNATAMLVVEQLAARAADHVVEADLEEGDRGQRKLLNLVDADDSDEALLLDQLVELQLRLYGQTLERDDPMVQQALALHQGARESTNDGRRAWTITLYAMLQDIRMTHY